MSEDSKTIILPEGNNVDPNLMMALNGNGGFGGGMNNPFWAIVLLAFLRNNFGWSGNGDTSFVSSQLGQAIAGNANALSNLSTHLDCSIGQVQTALSAVQQSMNQCCCDNKLLFTQQNYENRINNTEQTAILGGKIDQQTTLINDRFCQLEMREMQNKLDSERAKNLALTNQLSQEHQNAYFASMLAPIQNEVASIKCKLPETVTVPAPTGTLIPACVSWQLGLNQFGFNPNGSIWS